MDELVQKLDDDATPNFLSQESAIVKYRNLKATKIRAVQSAKEKAAYLAEAINEKQVKRLL